MPCDQLILLEMIKWLIGVDVLTGFVIHLVERVVVSLFGIWLADVFAVEGEAAGVRLGLWWDRGWGMGVIMYLFCPFFEEMIRICLLLESMKSKLILHSILPDTFRFLNLVIMLLHPSSDILAEVFRLLDHLRRWFLM